MIGRYQPQIVIKPYRKKRKKRKKWFIGFIISVCIFLLFVYLALHSMVKREMKEIKNIEKENRYFRKEIPKLSNSDVPYEELIRIKYGYIRKGEKLIIYSPFYYYKNNETKEEVR